ncbi:hypothetical protein [Acinetobacter larvae]|uniref:DUF3304 domain-containing protein n=1 Tax=Acinetobacter larvae TaxID=1789224 RepID=A0A1B2M3Y3_9GAMM|nr:hypothetical protein [Acinetobacter larvae]AOA59898.1 hypothetical protein BFG52_06020 [Acinetobacter larvae]
MNLKKLILFPVTLLMGVVSCATTPFSTYDMATTSFNYDPRYTSDMVRLNGVEIGGGFGGAISTDPIKVGHQVVTWKETNSKRVHQAKNEVIITREQLKGKKYLAAHLYPDETVEIITSDHWPDPTEKGLAWQKKLRDEMKQNKE